MALSRWNSARRTKIILVALVVLMLLICGLFITSKYDHDDSGSREDYAGNGESAIIVTIPYDTGLARAGEILQTKDVIRSTEVWNDTLESYRHYLATLPPSDPDYREGGEPDIQPGTYEMKLHWPSETALRWLVDPAHRITLSVEIPAGQQSWEVGEILADEGGLPDDDVRDALSQPEELGLPAYATAGVEGYLFPGTYEVIPSATGMLSLMVEAFKAWVGETDLEAGLTALNESLGLDLTVNDIVTVASLIELEVNQAEDQAKVARTIYNRLKDGMKLQLDSAIVYAMEKDGVNGFQLSYDSPYNTYLHSGIPPGPISNPGVEALRAALQPAAGPWLYWVTVNYETGETRFTDNAEEHAANVQVRDAYCRDSLAC